MSRKNTVTLVEQRRSCIGLTAASIGSVGAVIFLLNLSFGLVEIPDNLPIIGNLDEVAASALLFSCLSYLGLDLLPFTSRGRLRIVGRTEASVEEADE